MRVKDLDFDYHQITVRDGKGAKGRHIMLPESLDAPLWRQHDRVRSIFESARVRSLPGAATPPALERKYPSLRWNGLGSSCSRRAVFVPARVNSLT